MKFLSGISKEQNEKLKKQAHDAKTILDNIPSDAKVAQVKDFAKKVGLL